jgi:hypothetical protein
MDYNCFDITCRYLISDGCSKGDNFSCDLKSVEIEAEIKSRKKKLNLMTKCLPMNEFRVKLMTEVSRDRG